MQYALHASGTSSDYTDVTELAGDDVSPEQVERVCRRYAWALTFTAGKDVLEVACGSGPGLGLLQKSARTFRAGDISPVMIEKVRAHYKDRIDARVINAEELPFEAQSLDVVIIFEALYYLPNPARFVDECLRVLRPGGVVLVSNANKDLFDFNPSPHSHTYHGVSELTGLFGQRGFTPAFWGDVPIRALSIRQRLLRPIKKFVVGMGLMPKTMAGKKLLKRLVFGNLMAFPSEIAGSMLPQLNLSPLAAGAPDTSHKVIFCAAQKL